MAIVLQTTEELKRYFDEDRSLGNRLIGECPELVNSKVVFADDANDNLLAFGNNVRLVDSSIVFQSCGSLFRVGANNRELKLQVDLHNDNTFAIGQRAYTNGPLRVILSERRNVVIGDDALLSFGIWIRNADPHLVFSAKTMRRVNPSKDVLIGDHVWIGQSRLILKGSIVGSGAIIGGHAVVAGKRIPSNTSWAGNPAKCIAEGVFFDSSCVHRYTASQTSDSMTYDSEKWIYASDGRDSRLLKLSASMEGCATPQERLALLDEAFADSRHNRFAVPEDPHTPVAGLNCARRWFKRK